MITITPIYITLLLSSRRHAPRDGEFAKYIREDGAPVPHLGRRGRHGRRSERRCPVHRHLRGERLPGAHEVRRYSNAGRGGLG